MSRLNRLAATLLISSNVWNFADGLLGPLFAVFAGTVGGNVFDISWAWSIYLVVTGVCTICIGYVSDHLPKRYVLLVGYSLTTLFTFGYTLVSNPWQFFAIQAGLGFALALSNPTWLALFHENVARDKYDATAWGLSSGRDKIATGLAALCGGMIVTYTSFQTLFLIMGTIQLFGTLYLASVLLRREPRRR
jgi:MFS family permease